MKDVQLIRQAHRLREVGEPYTIVTVVRIDGSTYRRPGARMLVDTHATTYGMISGGCLEEEVAQRACKAIAQGSVQLASFDLGQEDLLLGYGTGCNGNVHILIEPVPSPNRTDPVLLIETCLEQRQSGVLAQIIEGPEFLGRKLLFLEDGKIVSTLPSPLRDTITTKARNVLAGGRHTIATITDQQSVEVLFEIIHPPIKLVLLGSGHDVEPIVLLAKNMGWHVCVVGQQPATTLARRTPSADQHIFLMHPEDVLDYVQLDNRTATVVMNHHYERDKALIRMLLQSHVQYVGVLGPRDRTERIKKELHEIANVERIYGPVGLDIGTETPEEIALSIVAEIQAVHHRRTGGMLRHRTGTIHQELLLPEPACLHK